MKCYHESFGGEHILPVCWIRDMDWSKIKRNNFMGRFFLRILTLPQIADVTGARFFSFLLWLDHQIHYRWIMCSAHNYKGRTTVPSGSCLSLFHRPCVGLPLVEKANYVHLQDSSIWFVAKQL